MKRLLIQTQLSNYTKDGKFVLECDSGWQMCISRATELLRLIPDLRIDLTGPLTDQCITSPLATKLLHHANVCYIPMYVPPDAPLSRHHFDSRVLLRNSYDTAYINDPMQLRNYMALLGKKCKLYASHNHFIDNPSCPKFGGMLWLGQCEAVRRADVNFWQCESALKEFEADFGAVAPNSYAWDDGYSVAEITSPVANTRFQLPYDKPIVFVPNRVGGRGRSSDYTNCGKFLFEVVPQLRKKADFYVITGNPGQKFSNQELVDECGVLDLVPGPLTRDEYKYVAANSSIAVALYDKDTYGGTAIRECIELGCRPLWLNCYEYGSISRAASYPFTCTWETIVETALKLLTEMADIQALQTEVRRRCSIEATTGIAAQRLDLL